MPQLARIAHDEANAIEATVLEARNVHAIEGDVRGQSAIEPLRLSPELHVFHGLAVENTRLV